MRAQLLPESLEKLPLDSGSKRRLSSYLSRIKRDEEHVLFDDQVVKVALEYSFRPQESKSILARLAKCKSKADGLPFGRSVGRYSSMVSIWKKFSEPEKPDFRWNKRFRAAIQKVADRYSEASLTAIPLPTTVEEAKLLLSEWRTSGGWESILTGKRYKGDILDKEYVKGLAGKVTKALEEGRFNYPILPGYRTQCSELPNLDCKHKKRPVNMITLTVVLCESLFANPISGFLTTYPYSAIGKDDRFDIPRWVHQQQVRGYSWISLDYSNYDSTIPSWLIDAAFKVLRLMFKKLTPEQEALWDVLVNSFVVKDFVTPDGLLHVTHGNPSGSKFTSIINGVCNEIMTEYWADLLGREVRYMIMGDDNLIYFSDGRPITVEEIQRITDVLSKKIGIEANWQKVEYGKWDQDPRFLSRFWKATGAWRSHDELLSLLAYPERYRDYKGTQLTPELLIFSYILGCEAGMRAWFNVDKFLMDNPRLKLPLSSKEVLREVPYTVRLSIELALIGQMPKQLSYC